MRTVSWSLVAAGIICAAPVVLAQVPGDGRPLATVLREMESRSGIQITYEDPQWSFDGDVVDVTSTVGRGAGRGRVLVPSGTAFSFDLPPVLGGKQGVDALLPRLLASYNGSGNNGRFEIARDGDIFHVVPVMSRNKSGQLVRFRSRLDVEITLGTETRTVAQSLQALVEGVSKANGTRMIIGAAPVGLLSRGTFMGSGRSSVALTTITEVLAATGEKLSWQIFCDPGPFGCALNIHAIPAKSSQ